MRTRPYSPLTAPPALNMRCRLRATVRPALLTRHHQEKSSSKGTPYPSAGRPLDEGFLLELGLSVPLPHRGKSSENLLAVSAQDIVADAGQFTPREDNLLEFNGSPQGYLKDGTISAFGTKQTFISRPNMSAFGGKADMSINLLMS